MAATENPTFLLHPHCQKLWLVQGRCPRKAAIDPKLKASTSEQLNGLAVSLAATGIRRGPGTSEGQSGGAPGRELLFPQSSCSSAAWFLQHPRQSVTKGPLRQLGISTSHHRHSCGGPRPSILGPGRVGSQVASVTSARWKGAVQATERPVTASLPLYTHARKLGITV